MISKALEEIRRARGEQDTAALDEAYNQALSELPLAALRRACNLTQADMAERLGNSQAAVSKLEGRGDFLCSTLFRYARSLGAKIDVTISVGSHEFSLEQREVDDDLVFALTERSKKSNAEKNNVIQFKGRATAKASARDRLSIWLAEVDRPKTPIRTELFAVEACG